MFWIPIAILLIGAAAAIVNDAAYGGRLFDSWMVARGAALSALAIWIGHGFWRGMKTSQWLHDALIWTAIVLAAMLLYRLVGGEF